MAVLQQFDKGPFHPSEKNPVIDHFAAGGIPRVEIKLLVSTTPRTRHRHPNTILRAFDVMYGFEQAIIGCKIIRLCDSNDITPGRVEGCLSEQRFGSTADFRQYTICTTQAFTASELAASLIIVGLPWLGYFVGLYGVFGL